MIRLNPFRFLGEKKFSSICPKKSTENSIQMVSALELGSGSRPGQVAKLQS